jgi:excisionase family DNA binding protein
MQNSQTSLLTISEASTFLNVKVSRLRTAVLTKEIPFLKMGRLIRFDKTDLLKWIEELKTKTQKKSASWF